MKSKILVFLFAVMTCTSVMAWPTRDLQFVIPYPAGGASDTLARNIAAEISASLGVNVQILHAPGAANVVAINHMLQGPKNHIFMFTLSEFNIAAAANHNKADSVYKKFVPSIVLVTAPIVVVGNRDHSVDSFTKKIRSNKTSNLGSQQGLTPHNLWLESIKSDVFNVVHYKGTVQMVTDVIGGIIDYGAGSSLALDSYIQTGQVIPLMTSGEQRMRELPNVPTSRELGFRGPAIESWFAVLVRDDTDTEVIERFNAAARNAMLKNSKLKQLAQTPGLAIKILNVTESKKYIESDLDLYLKLTTKK